MAQADAPKILHPSATPTFVVGAERSGSTLLRLMLDQHSQVSMSHQMEFLVDYIDPEGPEPDALDLLARLRADPVFQRSKLEVGALAFSSSAQLVENLLHQRGRGCAAVGGTVHRHFDRLRARWPQARFIHLVRDPRAVAPSAVRMGWDGTPFAAAERWLRSEQEWDALEAKLDPEAWIEVRFEDLVRDAKATLTKVCAFLGVAYEPAMLTYSERSTYGPVDPAAADAWRKNPAPWARDVERRVGNMMVRRGYTLESKLEGEPSALEKAAFAARERLQRTRIRQQRYGFRLWAKDVLARRLGAVTQWVERVDAETAEIERGHIK